MKNNQIHIEIPADDIQRAQKFYTGLFGWKITKFDMPESGMEYWGVDITGIKCNDSPNVSAGMMKRQSADHKITNYVVVESLEDSQNKIKESGGKVIVPTTEVPTVGKFAICLDTEGNKFAVWQNSPDCCAGSEKTSEEGESNKNNAIHFEIPADDVSRAKAFYENIFGWKISKIEMSECDMEYWGINVTGEDMKKVKPSICGGLMKRQSPMQQGILNYVVVESEVETFVSKIENLGGNIVVPVTEIPNVGKFVIFQDPEENMIAIWKCNTDCKK